jgi:poly-beta-1,6-N-acetyl-D-glucosamine synthase
MEIQKTEEINYILITPTKNEEKYIEKTIQSVINQSILPLYWFIVNDNSTDNTANIIESYAREYPFIRHKLVKNFRPDLKSTGARSAALRNYLREIIRELPSEIIVSIDSDISFEPDFFERLFATLKNNIHMGIVSGHLVNNGKPERLNILSTNRGAVRVYARKCFDQIGRYYEGRGEDQMDTYTAQFYGWETRTEPVYFQHLKQEGIRHTRYRNHFVTGNYKGRIPYYFPYFLLTLVKHAFRYPVVIGSLAQLYAYCVQRFIIKDNPFPKDVCKFIVLQQKNWMRNFATLYNRR